MKGIPIIAIDSYTGTVYRFDSIRDVTMKWEVSQRKIYRAMYDGEAVCIRDRSSGAVDRLVFSSTRKIEECHVKEGDKIVRRYRIPSRRR